MNDSPPLVALRRELSALDSAYSLGHHGRWSASRRSDLVADALVRLWKELDPPPDVALAAVGGFGRRQLAPASDLDIAVLHRSGDVSKTVEGLLYPLWDAGFTVGHAVWTPEEALAAASAHVETTTSLLDIRPIAGDASVVGELASAVLARVSAEPSVFAEDLSEEALSRRDRFGSTAHLLEPDLRDGAGGLRDIQSIAWVERAFGMSLLRDAEREVIGDAEEFLVRARSALHLLSGRKLDRLLLDHQAEIADAMGFADEPRLPAPDGLMRAVFEHARRVEHLADEIVVAGHRTESRPAPEASYSSPAEVLDLFALAAAEAREPSTEELDAAESLDLPEVVEWDDAVREGFLRLLRVGPAAGGALAAMDDLGLLVRFVPEWAEVRSRPQRDPYHRYTVDAHLIQTFTGVSRMLRDPDLSDPVEAEAAKEIVDADGLLMGALLHDIGKNGEGGHVMVGDRVAEHVLSRMGLSAETRAMAQFMVREHLLLPDTATRRDLSDENLVLDIAARVGGPERLAALYLLAKADAAATGPAAWTPWRQALIRELVGKVQRSFDRGQMGEELAQKLADRVGVVRELLAIESESEVQSFVLRMPRGYFLSIAPERAARHFATLAPELGSNEVRTAVADGSRPGTYELLVVAADRRGLLSWIAGALTLCGVSILTAQVFTAEDGTAADVFQVQGAFEATIAEERWREFRSLLRRAIEGRISLARRVDEKRSHYSRGEDPVPLTIAVDNESSEFATVIEVGAADRIGLLYDITRTFSDLDLDVHLAKVATYTGRVIDAFYVRDSLGTKVEEEEQIDALTEALRDRLGHGSSPGSTVG